MLHWYAGGRQDSLELRDVEPEDGHAERKGDGREEVKILSGFVESGRVLEEAQAASADGH